MTDKAIRSFINDGGATLAKTGAPVGFKSGYQVSKKDCYIINAADVSAVLAAVRELLETIDAADFVGLWVDAGLVYIDVSEKIEEREEALRVGKARKQLSIFGWAEKSCIDC